MGDAKGFTPTKTNGDLSVPIPGPSSYGVRVNEEVQALYRRANLVIVRAAADDNVDILTDLESGDAIGSVTLATGNLVLLPAQDDPTENGVYVVPASGAASRASGFTLFSQYPGLLAIVSEGALAGQFFRCSSIAGGAIGVDDIDFGRVRFGTTVFNVLDYGAVADYETVSNAAMSSGSHSLTSASNPFTPGDVGKYIAVQGAGAAGVNLFTTISAHVSAGQVTLTDANASGGTISSKVAEWGTDDAAAFNAAIAAASAAAGGQVYAPPGSYLISQIDGTQMAGGVELAGDYENATRLFPMQCAAYSTSHGHVIDLAGTAFTKLRRLQIGAFYSLPLPKTAIFLAQIASGASNRITLDEVYVSGQYAVSTFYNYGVPSSIGRACDFYNYKAGAGAHNCMTYTADNRDSLDSANVTVTTGDQSTSDWLFDGCEWHKFAGAGANNDVVKLDQVSNILFKSGVISGGATQYVTFEEANSYVTFDNVTMETESQPVTPTNAFNLASGATVNGFAAPNTSYIISGARFAGSGTIQSLKNGQQYQANSAASLSAGTTYFVGVGCSDTVAPTNVASLCTEASIVCNLKALTSASPGTAKTYVITLQKNGSDTALTATISGAGTTASDNAHYVEFAAGDYIGFKVVTLAGANATRFAGSVSMLPMG